MIITLLPQQMAMPRLMTVWFNAWMYVGDQQIWAGLIVEVVHKLEQQLPFWNRCWLAFRYNWQSRRSEVVLKLFLPLLLLILGFGWFVALAVLVAKNSSTVRIRG